MEQNILDVTPENIWNYKQNHPELVIKDLKEFGFTNEACDIVRISMLAKGINKWLKVRRDIIAYKKLMRHEIKQLQEAIPLLKEEMSEKWVNFDKATKQQITDYFKAREKYIIAKESLKIKEKIRADLKSMCMTNRWQIWRGRKLEEMNTIFASD